MGSTPKGWQRGGTERMGFEKTVNERLGMGMGNERMGIGDESKKMPPAKGWPMRMADERVADEYGDEIDLMDRDPKNLNTDVVKIDFVDVIAEPEGIHSIGIFWKASFITFTFTKTCIYHFLTAVFGIPLAGLWGIIFAIFSLFHIWFIEPIIRFIMIPVQWLGRIYSIFINLFCAPIFDAIGKSCSHIRVQNVSS